MKLTAGAHLSWARRAMYAAFAFALAAMLPYPGGTARDPTTTRYSFSRNFISDVANTVSFGGQPNGLSAVLATGSAARACGAVEAAGAVWLLNTRQSGRQP